MITHMHCDYSCDSHMKIAAAIEAADKQNIGIVITEHWDDDYPTNPTAFMFDVDDYFARFGTYRSEKVLLGIEIGMQKQTAAADEALAAAYPLIMCWHPCTASMAAIYMKNAAMPGRLKSRRYVSF